MTIDEAISKYRKLAENDRCCNREEAQQLAEWLEELKKYQSYKPVDKEFYKAGYNKAIQDFVTKLKEETFDGYVTLEDYFEDSIECVAVEDIVMIAEQLKEGSAGNE